MCLAHVEVLVGILAVLVLIEIDVHLLEFAVEAVAQREGVGMAGVPLQGGTRLDGMLLGEAEVLAVDAEVEGHPEIFDQITITRLSAKELQKYYKFQETDKKLFKADVKWLKFENIIKNGQFDSYLIDLIKKLEQNIEKEIYN